MTARRLLCLTLLMACSDAPSTAAKDSSTPIPDQELLIRVSTGVDEVELGEGFPLAVVRVWSSDLVPDPWNDQALSPLQVQPLDVSQREDGRHIEETRRFRGHAFLLGEVTIPPLILQATHRETGTVRVASSEEVRIGVTSALGDGDPGPAELPRGPFAAPFPWLYWSSVGVVILASLGLVTWYTRWRARLPAPPPPKLLPHEQALQMLRRLRELRPEGADQVKAYHVEASELLRTYMEGRFPVCISGMTTDEFLCAREVSAHLGEVHRRMLAEFLDLCDLAKFARHVPADTERFRLLAVAEQFVLETSGEQKGPSTTERGTR